MVVEVEEVEEIRLLLITNISYLKGSITKPMTHSFKAFSTQEAIEVLNATSYQTITEI